MKNYNYSGKIYVNNLSKVFQTALAIIDMIKLSLIKSEDHYRDQEHLLINEVINLNERF